MSRGSAPDPAGDSNALRRDRAHSQLLHRPPGASPVGVVAHLLAVQAQDPRSARLAVRSRSNGLLATDIDRELSLNRALVVGWLLRGTLHMVCAEDYGWLLGLTAPGRRAQSLRRLAQEGLAPAEIRRAVQIIERSLAADGPLTRDALADRVAAADIRAAGQAIVHMIMLTALRGTLIPAATSSDHHSFALTDDWLGTRPAAHLDGEARDAALGELARRYLEGHGPARDTDLARWAGLGLRDARRGLALIASELADLPGGLLGLRDSPPADAPLGPVLLPSYDPYLLGWEDRSFAVSPANAKLVHPGGGVLRAVVCVDGLALGTWTARRHKSGLTVAIAPFAPLPTDISPQLAADSADVARFEGVNLT